MFNLTSALAKNPTKMVMRMDTISSVNEVWMVRIFEQWLSINNIADDKKKVLFYL